MSELKIYQSRLPLYGPLDIKNIDNYLSTSKECFIKTYNAPCPYVIEPKHFKMLFVLGKGAFGSVLLVRDTKHCLYAMKVLGKRDIIEKKQLAHTLNEKRVLQSIDFPFCVRMEYLSKDNSHVYFIMPFVTGGEVFRHLRKAGNFNEELARFYAAQVVLAFEYLHNLHLIYRDLKPENLLIDHYGFLKVTDFGFTKLVLSRTYTLCGTPAYFAPEAINGQGYGKSVDWWALGVLIFEMNAGYEPFYSRDRMKVMAKILNGKYKLLPNFSPDMKNLISNLLTVDVTKRIGNLRKGVHDVKSHPWFKHVDWLELFNRRLLPPFLPRTTPLANYPMTAVKSEINVSNENEYEDEFKEF